MQNQNMQNQIPITQYRFSVGVKEIGNDDNKTFEDVDMVQVITLGDKNYMPVHEVDHYRSLMKRMLNNELIPAEQAKMFEAQYKLFKEGADFQHEGTSLATVAVFSKADVINLNNQNIFTVEQLSGVPDSAIHSLGRGIAMLKQKAITYLDSKTDANAINKVIQQNEMLINERNHDKQALAEMQAQIQQLLAQQNAQTQETKSKSK